MGEFAKAVATLKLELRCPHCGNDQPDQIDSAATMPNGEIYHCRCCAKLFGPISVQH